MKRKFFLMLFLATTYLFAVNLFQERHSDITQSEIIFQLPNYEFEDIADYKKVNFIDLDIETEMNALSEPALPSFSTLIFVPKNKKANLNLEIMGEEYHENISIIPSRRMDSENRFIDDFDAEVYQSYKNPEIAEITEYGVMRNYQVARVVINPFQYDVLSKKLEVKTGIKLKVSFENSNNQPQTYDGLPSREYDKFVQSLVANPSLIAPRSEYQQTSYLIIHTVNQEIENILGQLADWKRQKGYHVDLVSTAIAGNTTNQIKAYIQSQFDNSEYPPEYILLAGDGDGSPIIPTFFEQFAFGQSAHGDHPYTELFGNDTFSDAFIGRFSFNTLSTLQTMVNKVISYEKMTLADESEWLNDYLLYADPTSSGVSTIFTMNYIEDLVDDLNPGAEFHRVYSSPFIEDMAQALNSGVGAFFYRGFGDFSGWTYNDTQALLNTNMLPFTSMMTCFTGDFASPGGLSEIEQFTRLGTPNNLRGAVAAIGSSSATHTCFNNLLTVSIAQSLYHLDYQNLGMAHTFAKIALFESYPDNPMEYVDWYTIGKSLLGDPGMTITRELPRDISAEFPAVYNQESEVINVDVIDEDGNPIESALVSIFAAGTEQADYSYTDDNGQCSIPLENNGSADELLITITKQDHKTLIDTIFLNQDTTISFDSVIPQTDFTAGEEVVFDISIENHTNSVINDLPVTISTAEERITISQASAEYSIPANSTSSESFTCNLAGNFIDAEEVVFHLEMGEGMEVIDDQFLINVQSADFEIIHIVSDDEADPGAEYQFGFDILNNGNLTLTNTTVSLSVPNTVTLISGEINDLQFDEQALTSLSSDSFQIEFSENLIGGQIIDFELDFTDEIGFVQTVPFSIELGEAEINDPTGPDNYGYLLYDDEDDAYSQSNDYVWIEIDPDLGGNGISLEMTDSDMNGSGDMETIELPISFRFYGKLYNHLSISSNGFLIPGVKDMEDWMNWPIPGPFLPEPLIAPFWDDLIINEDSDVLYYFDEEMGALIVEWSHLLNKHSLNEETFQAVLYDASVNSSNLGDSVIKFNYQTINNDDLGNYDNAEIDHGEFATVGIANEISSDGIEYTYANDYPVTAKPLENEMTITLSGPTQPINDPYLILSDLDFWEVSGNMNDIIDAGDEFAINADLQNLGIETAENVIVNLSSDDDYIQITQSQISYGDIENNEITNIIENFIFSVDENCPNKHVAEFYVEISGADFSRSEEFEITVNAKELKVNSYEISDDNDGFIDINETGYITFAISKESYLPITLLQMQLTFDNEDVTVEEESLEFEQVDEDTLYTTFTITTNNVTQGENIPFELTINYDGLEDDFSGEIMFGTPLSVFSEDFEDGLTGWIGQNDEIGEENHAGGSGYELLLTSIFNGSFSYSISPQIVLFDARKLVVSFDANKFGDEASYGVVLMMPSESTYLFTDNVNSDGAQYLTFEYDFDQPYNGQLQLYFYLQSGSEQESVFAIDNIDAKIITGNRGTIEGNFIFDENEADYDEIDLSFDEYIVEVEDDGSFFAELPAGQYQMKVDLFGYYLEDQIVDIVANENLEMNDLLLEYLEKPINLTYTLDDDFVHLDWELENDATRSSRQPDVSAYRIEMTVVGYGSYDILIEPDSTSYSRQLYVEAEYQFKVAAEYDEAISDWSNQISIEYTDNINDAEIPQKFSLHQNYPNPFNPETNIAFDLPQSSQIGINIYNTKGQLIKKLANKQYPAGKHNIVWHGKNSDDKKVSSGVYFYEILIDGKRFDLKKCLLLK